MLTTSILFGLVLGLIAFTIYAAGLPSRGSGQHASITPTPQPARHRRIDASVQPLTWLHDAPDQLPEPDEAHRIMQLHVECRTTDCGRKAAAFDTLVTAGAIRPRS